ncbi:MAG: LuxR family transcriptional regulator [Mucinivorans sp.]
MKNVEFYTTPQGEVEIKSAEGVRTYTRECKEVTNDMCLAIENDYPGAFRALSSEYKRSADNPAFFKFLVVHRFMRCNFGRYDHIDDIDGNGAFHFERVECPLAGHECKFYGIICNPKFNTDMGAMQTDVMMLYCRNVDPYEIAERLNTTFDNVRAHIAKAYRKKNVHSKSEFCQWAEKNNIFQNL